MEKEVQTKGHPRPGLWLCRDIACQLPGHLLYVISLYAAKEGSNGWYVVGPTTTTCGKCAHWLHLGRWSEAACSGVFVVQLTP